MARQIASYFPDIIERAAKMASFQNLLNDCETAASRKQMIMTAWQGSLINSEECRLLIEAYGLETA